MLVERPYVVDSTSIENPPANSTSPPSLDAKRVSDSIELRYQFPVIARVVREERQRWNRELLWNTHSERLPEMITHHACTSGWEFFPEH